MQQPKRICLHPQDVVELERLDAERRAALNARTADVPSEEDVEAAVDAMIDRQVFAGDEQQIQYLQNCIRNQALALRVALQESRRVEAELREANAHIVDAERLIAWAALICGGIGLVAGWLGCLVRVRGW